MLTGKAKTIFGTLKDFQRKIKWDDSESELSGST